MGSGASKGKKIARRSDAGESRILSVPFLHSKDHVNAMLENLTEFQKNGDYCDLKLQITDKASNTTKIYNVHKCLLAACSGYCKEKLGQGTTDSPPGDGQSAPNDEDPGIINIDFPVSSTIMDSVIKFLYTADFELKIKDIPELLEAAVRLKITSLKKHCVWALQSGYVLEFFPIILDLSENLDLSEVRDFVLRRTIEKFEDFVDSHAFLQLTEKTMQVLMDNRRGWVSDDVIIPEVEMFNAVLKWEKHNHKERESFARHLLRCLHYHKIPRTTLSGYVITHELVTGDKELMTSIEESLGSDKKRILQRLRRRTVSQGLDTDDDDINDVISNGGSGDGPVFSTHPTLLICGGRLFDQMTAQILQLNERLNTWHEVTRIPTVLSHHGAVVIDNSLYIVGGEDTTISGCHSISHMWRYDPIPKDDWTALPDMHQGRSFFFLGALNDYIFAFGGKSGKLVRNSAEKYNIATKRWEFVASLKATRYAHAGCAHKNMLYVNGGIVGKHSSIDMLRLDVIANHWTIMSPMRCARSRHCMVPVRDRIYVIGGEDDSLGVTRPASIAIECYTPEYDQWHSVALKIPVQSDGEFGCAELDGHIFVVGGCKNQLAEHRSDVSTYDPEEDHWEVKTKLPRRLRGGVCAVLDLCA